MLSLRQLCMAGRALASEIRPKSNIEHIAGQYQGLLWPPLSGCRKTY